MSNNGTIIFIIPSKAYQITILPPENHGLRSIGLINVHLKVHESYSSTCLWSSVSSEIHQVDSDRYFGKASFLLDSLDLGSQHLAGVRQACKDDVVLLRDISEFFLSAVRIRIALLSNLLFSRRRDSWSPTRRHFFSRSMTFVSNS